MQQKYKTRIAAVLATSSAYLACAAPPAARPGSDNTPQARQAHCEKDVRDYTETLRFVRQSAGEQIGNRVAAGFVDEAQLQRVTQASGPCAAAQLLRDKGAIR